MFKKKIIVIPNQHFSTAILNKYTFLIMIYFQLKASKVLFSAQLEVRGRLGSHPYSHHHLGLTRQERAGKSV